MSSTFFPSDRERGDKEGTVERHGENWCPENMCY